MQRIHCWLANAAWKKSSEGGQSTQLALSSLVLFKPSKISLCSFCCWWLLFLNSTLFCLEFFDSSSTINAGMCFISVLGNDTLPSSLEIVYLVTLSYKKRDCSWRHHFQHNCWWMQALFYLSWKVCGRQVCAEALMCMSGLNVNRLGLLLCHFSCVHESLIFATVEQKWTELICSFLIFDVHGSHVLVLSFFGFCAYTSTVLDSF